MFDLVPSLVAGAVFGLALAAPPGPMNAVIAEESVLRGWTAGAKAGLGAGTADFIFFLLALAGVVSIVDRSPTLKGALFAVGGLLMLYFAYGAAMGVRASFAPSSVDSAGPDSPAADAAVDADSSNTDATVDADSSAPESGPPFEDDESTGFRRAFVLALTNPYQILFWLTAGVGLLDPGSLDVLAVLPYVGDALAGLFVVETGSVALIVGLFGGVGLWLVCFPAALVQAGRRMDSFAPAVAAVSALVLGGFGVSFLVEAWRILG